MLFLGTNHTILNIIKEQRNEIILEYAKEVINMDVCNYNYNVTYLGIIPETLVFVSDVAQEENSKSFAVGNRKLNYINFYKIVGRNVIKYMRFRVSEPKKWVVMYYLYNKDRLMIILFRG